MPLRGPLGSYPAECRQGSGPLLLCRGTSSLGPGPGPGGVQKLQKPPGPGPPVWRNWSPSGKVFVQLVLILNMTVSDGGAHGDLGDPGAFGREKGIAGLLGQASAAHSRVAFSAPPPALWGLCSCDPQPPPSGFCPGLALLPRSSPHSRSTGRLGLMRLIPKTMAGLRGEPASSWLSPGPPGPPEATS